MESKPLSHYGFDYSNFRHIEKTVNFANKLDQINTLMEKKVIDGIREAIKPSGRSLSVLKSRRLSLPKRAVDILHHGRAIQSIYESSGRLEKTSEMGL